MLEILVIILIFALSYFLIAKNFDLALKVLLVLSVFLHKEVFSIYKWDLLPVRFFMLALTLYVGLFVAKWLLRERDLKKALDYFKDPFILLVLGIWIVRGVSIIFSRNLNASILLYGFFTTIVVLAFTLYIKLKDRPKEILGLIRFYTFVALGLTAFGVFQMYLYTQHEVIIGALWNVPGHIARIGSTFWDVNHFAALLAALLPILGVLILVEGPLKKRVGMSTMFVFMTGMLLLTSSRTSWIIALVSFMSFLTILLIRKWGSKGVLYLLLTLFLLFIPVAREYSIKSSPFRAYVKDNFHYRLDSFASHMMLLTGSYQIFEDFPILGGGYGSFFEHFRKTEISATFFGRDPAALNTRVPAHTIWGEAIAETGVLGLSLLVLMVGTLLGVLYFGALKIEDKKNHLLLNAMFSTVLGLFTAGIFYSYNSEFFWLILLFYYLFGISIVLKKFSFSDVFEFYVRSPKFYFGWITAIAAVLIFSGLGSTHLIPWDEAIYSKIAKNMVLRSEYLDLTWISGTIWFEKPPFMMWSMAAFMKFLGFTSLAARLPSAIFGFLTVLVTFLMSKKYFGKVAAFFAALSLVTSVHFLYYSRAAMIDVTTTFFITLGLYLYLIAKEKAGLKFWILSGISIGFGVLTKGAIGILPLAIIGTYELYLIVFKGQSLSKSHLWKYLTLFVAVMLIALPWHLVQYIRYKEEFLNTYLIYHVFDRATQAIEDKGQPIYWYFIVMKVSMRIWFVVLLAAFPAFLFKSAKKNDKFVFFTIWFSIVFALFSFASSKIVWYIIPIYPAASIMVGYFIDIFYKRFSRVVHVFKRPAFKFLFVFVVTVFALTYFFYNRKLVYTDDFTGAQAELLQLKDVEFGNEQLLYVDRVDLPIVLFYTDGPFEIIDFEPSKGRAPKQTYDKRVVILAKRGRYSDDIPFYNKESKVVGEKGDYILWYYESDLEIDRERLDDVRKELNKLYANPTGNAPLIDVLTIEEAELIKDISAFEPT